MGNIREKGCFATGDPKRSDNHNHPMGNAVEMGEKLLQSEWAGEEPTSSGETFVQIKRKRITEEVLGNGQKSSDERWSVLESTKRRTLGNGKSLERGGIKDVHGYGGQTMGTVCDRVLL